MLQKNMKANFAYFNLYKKTYLCNPMNWENGCNLLLACVL